MAFFTNTHASLHHHFNTHFRPSQCITTISYERRQFALPRCAAAKQTTLQLLTAAQERVALRAAESSREEPLFHDPYAACLAAVKEETLIAAPVVEANGGDVGYYELATSFIDEKLMEAVKNDGDTPVRQIVLLTDGMDTRPYRLPWPPASTVFDVSPSTTYNVAAERLEAVGARIRRGCMFRHVSVDLSEDGDWKDESWERNLVSVGYQGTRPSIWAMQGLQTLTADGLEVILRCVSSLAMKDSIFLGELPCTALGDISQENISAALSRVFGGNGFHVSLVLHTEISASAWSKNRPLTEINEQDHEMELLFVAKQLRLSDHQASFGVPFSNDLDAHKSVVFDRNDITLALQTVYGRRDLKLQCLNSFLCFYATTTVSLYSLGFNFLTLYRPSDPNWVDGSSRD